MSELSLFPKSENLRRVVISERPILNHEARSHLGAAGRNWHKTRQTSSLGKHVIVVTLFLTRKQCHGTTNREFGITARTPDHKANSIADILNFAQRGSAKKER